MGTKVEVITQDGGFMMDGIPTAGYTKPNNMPMRKKDTLILLFPRETRHKLEMV